MTDEDSNAVQLAKFDEVERRARDLVGIEILDASSRLHPDLLEEAEILSR